MGASYSTEGHPSAQPHPAFASLAHASGSANNQHAVAALLAYKLAQAQAQAQAQAHAGVHPNSASKVPAASPPPPKPKSKPVLPPSSAGQCPIPHDQRDAYLAGRSAASSSSSSSSSSSPLGYAGRTGGGGGSMAPAPAEKASWSSKLNPLNMMPEFNQGTAPDQQSILSTERTMSSIPRSRSSPAPGASPYDAPSACPVPHEDRKAAAGGVGGAAAPASQDESGSKWEYPSPQQFYNALVRKGWETPEEHVETMVLIHNFLNEQAWLEVLEWEKLAGADASRAELARFQGKPGTLSPKARVFGLLATLMPSRFSEEPPFDRHDWVVRRPDQDGREVRYVIDYYSVPDDPEREEPEFVLDVRPALDSFESLRVRAKKTFQEWSEASSSQQQQTKTAGNSTEEALERGKDVVRKGEEGLVRGVEKVKDKVASAAAQ
ncbi:uncharacterized protein PFL1_01119 [Pseudozyma flocculosa PF-1]|uniref:uncharacterized protein n=1 Tax=Pseudozyma flocculosa PF-1 TaxID=1277687 RepID=UPI0004561656|nr:uncharacterized protein PFL1_01119 [Pseudozyma flocculosa PF-1]EPQ31787.1 hypothetical protein PFL1_01119 [Pseudozyma flocculosa PF-1]